ncbi:MAG: fumarate reductase subunit C [Acidobacteria bacterium]|nr:fumarate reductase subunit C [Acidobacteriota bacterium]MCZ6504754.1 fumarate reductase subunit C [Actinomycetota bacterium]MCZ6739675.1 fumarate reductase subunit C [Actinomycetota bacterium]
MTRELTRPLPWNWWLKKAVYFQFMMRELTSLAVFAYALLIIWALLSAADAGAFSTFYTFLSSSLSVWLHLVILVLALYHTGTWIALTPKVMVLWRGDERVDPGVIAGANSILFLMISGAVIWLVLM